MKTTQRGFPPFFLKSEGKDRRQDFFWSQVMKLTIKLFFLLVIKKCSLRNVIKYKVRTDQIYAPLPWAVDIHSGVAVVTERPYQNRSSPTSCSLLG